MTLFGRWGDDCFMALDADVVASDAATVHRDRDAALARIAELERYAEAQKAVVLEARRDRTAANSRAEAANDATKAAVIRWQRAESEAEELRAEVEHLRGEHLHPCGAREQTLLELRAELDSARRYIQKLTDTAETLAGRALKAESEAASLRAEVAQRTEQNHRLVGRIDELKSE